MGIPSIGRAVFLDRDGVLNKPFVQDANPHPPASVAELEIYDGVRESLLTLRERDYQLIVVTNQPDVRRGKVDRAVVESINHSLQNQLPLDAIEVCYHDDEDACDCRKPKPGMIVRSAERFGVNLKKSFLVGDRWRDIEAGTRAGCTTIFVDRGYREGLKGARPKHTVRSLPEAVQLILNRKEMP